MIVFLYRIGIFLANRLPRKGAYVIGGCVAALKSLLARNDRSEMKENIKIIDQDYPPREYSDRVYRNFSNYLIEFFRLEKFSREFIAENITIHNEHYLRGALAKGKGVIVISAHLGNWEMAGCLIAKMGYPIDVMALRHSNEWVNNFFIRQRQMHGTGTIPSDQNLRNCFRTIQSGRILAMLADRDFTGHGVKINFFGKPARLPRGPALLTLKTECPMVPVFLVREDGGKFSFFIEKEVEYEKTGDRKKDLAALMSGYVRVFEKYIAEYVDQWCVFRKVWDFDAG